MNEDLKPQKLKCGWCKTAVDTSHDQCTRCAARRVSVILSKRKPLFGPLSNKIAFVAAAGAICWQVSQLAAIGADRALTAEEALMTYAGLPCMTIVMALLAWSERRYHQLADQLKAAPEGEVWLR